MKWSYRLLEEKGIKDIVTRSCVLNFTGIPDDHSVYNPCPFVQNGELRLLGRVESYTSEVSHVYEFKKEKDQWQCGELSFIHVQDPFLARIQNKEIIGGVALQFNEIFPGIHTIENYRTTFFDFHTKEKVAEGPDEMKDIRLIDIGDKIGVFTRPRSEQEGIVHSSIQFDVVSTLQDITPDSITAISLDPLKNVKGFFEDNEWGGVNAVYHLTDGWLGVLGHVAYYADHNPSLRKYAAIAFEFHPETKDVTHPVIILARNNIAVSTKPKREDLEDVIFPGGFIFPSAAETVLFFYGISDSHVGVSELSYPFHHNLDTMSEHNKLFTMDGAKALSTVGLE